MASLRTGIATGSASSSVDARAAKALVVRDRVRVAIGGAGRVELMHGDRRGTVVQLVSSTLGGATGGATLGGGTVDVTVGGVLMCLAVGADVVCMLVESACA